MQQSDDRHACLKSRIRVLYERHKGRYGYRRITAALRQAGEIVNYKTVERLMQMLGIKWWVHPKKYRARRGRAAVRCSQPSVAPVLGTTTEPKMGD